MSRWSFFLAVGLVLTGAVGTRAGADEAEGPPTSSNVLNATGLLLTPNAGIQRAKSVSGQVFGSGRFSTYGGQVSPHERFEIGLTYLDVHDSGTCMCSDLIVNAKLNLLKAEKGRPMVSVGVVDMFDEFDVDPSWYVVATQNLGSLLGSGSNLLASLGYGGGIYSDEWFAGLEMPLGAVKGIRNGQLSGILEYMDSDVSLGAKLRSGSLSATLAYFDTARWGGGITFTVPLK